MTDSALTHVYVLLDRSGSMSAIADDTVGGFAAFIREQRAVAGRCRLSLAQFDDTYERVYASVDIQDVPALDLQPRGSTALHDAMVRLIGEAGAELAALPEDERPGTVLVAVLTDGHAQGLSSDLRCRHADGRHPSRKDAGRRQLYSSGAAPPGAVRPCAAGASWT